MYDGINRNYGVFSVDSENSKSFGLLAGSCQNKGSMYAEDVTSNLAYDRYLGLLAYGTCAGHTKIINLSGSEYEKLSIFPDHAPITHVHFVPGKLMLVHVDAENRLVIRYLGDRYNIPSNFKARVEDRNQRESQRHGDAHDLQSSHSQHSTMSRTRKIRSLQEFYIWQEIAKRSND